MKCSIVFVSIAFMMPVVLFGATTAQAQTSAWRCTDAPGQQDCEEALINDIEDLVHAEWPSSLVVEMPPIGYTCTSALDGPGSEPIAQGELDWTLTLRGDLRSFLIGRHTASADFAGTVVASGDNVSGQWGDTTVNYLFQEGTREVMAPGGSTGVLDLGALSFFTPGGAFWNSTLSINIQLRGGFMDCFFGSFGGTTVRVTGRGIFRASFPVSGILAPQVVAEAVRERFRRAVRIAVTGQS